MSCSSANKHYETYSLKATHKRFFYHKNWDPPNTIHKRLLSMTPSWLCGDPKGLFMLPRNCSQLIFSQSRALFFFQLLQASNVGKTFPFPLCTFLGSNTQAPQRGSTALNANSSQSVTDHLDWPPPNLFFPSLPWYTEHCFLPSILSLYLDRLH